MGPFVYFLLGLRRRMKVALKWRVVRRERREGAREERAVPMKDFNSSTLENEQTH